MSAEVRSNEQGLCELVRQSCRAVSRSAQLVRISDERIEAYADQLALAEPPQPATAPSTNDLGDAERVAGSIIALDAVNFGSGYHDIIDKEPGLSGSRTIAARWARTVEISGVDAGRLAAITVADCTSIFGQDPTVPGHVELMSLFAQSLSDLGRHVQEHFDGSFVALVEAAAGSAETLATSLLAMQLYRDRATLGDQTVHFYKRAQITAADLARALPGLEAARFDDLDRLTAFADNLVPHVLLVDGLLDYHADLVAPIERRELLAPGSRAEVEIRAAGVEVVERLTAVLRRRGRTGRAMDVDLWLWERGGGARYKARPRHRTRCAFY